MSISHRPRDAGIHARENHESMPIRRNQSFIDMAVRGFSGNEVARHRQEFSETWLGLVPHRGRFWASASRASAHAHAASEKASSIPLNVTARRSRHYYEGQGKYRSLVNHLITPLLGICPVFDDSALSGRIHDLPSLLILD